MKRIFKYEIAIDGTEMPENAQIVHFNMQATVGGNVRYTVWAVVNPDAPKVKRKLEVRPTGGNVADADTYLGTCFDGPFVWHLFEVGQ